MLHSKWFTSTSSYDYMGRNFCPWFPVTCNEKCYSSSICPCTRSKCASRLLLPQTRRSPLLPLSLLPSLLPSRFIALLIIPFPPLPQLCFAPLPLSALASHQSVSTSNSISILPTRVHSNILACPPSLLFRKFECLDKWAINGSKSLTKLAVESYAHPWS